MAEIIINISDGNAHEMLTGFVDGSTPAVHESVITAASFFLSDYDANITTLNKETIPMTEMRDIMLSLTKEGKYRGIMQTTRRRGGAHREVASAC